MYMGRLHLIRQQVLWQAQVIFAEKLNPMTFLYRGDAGGTPGQFTIPPELQAEVDAEIARQNQERLANGTR